jgi:hypothetical protein
MATTRHDTVVTRWSIDHPVHELFPGLPRQKWKRRWCGQGAHGQRIYDWARVEVRPWHREDRRHWVLARRSVSRPQEISYYIAYCPADTTLDELIRIAGSRWAVEECFQTAKQECGLDDYQVRRYPGWHRHMTLAMAAHACLTVLQARELDAGKQKRIIRPRPPQPPRAQTPDPPPHPPPPGVCQPRSALVPLATQTPTPSPPQPLQTTRPHTTRTCPTVTTRTVAVLAGVRKVMGARVGGRRG